MDAQEGDSRIDGATFAEVECRDSQELCQAQGAGNGGWPTVKHYTKLTGTKGAIYPRKEAGQVCEELKKGSNLRDYVIDTVKQSKASFEGSKPNTSHSNNRNEM